MPLPVIAGIPWLAGVIGGLFSAVFSYFAQFLTKRVAIVATVIAVLVAITTTFFAVIAGIVSALSVAAPPQVSVAASLVVPGNATACASAYMAALVARWAYQWNVKVLQYKLF